MAILHKNITAAADIHNPKWFSGANNGDYAFKNEKGELESIDELLLPAALNFVDGSAAPPTTNSGDIYILSSGGSVNAGWGSVSLQDWVRYDGTQWNSITPQKSSLCYDKTADSLKVYDGASWAGMGSSFGNFSPSDGYVFLKKIHSTMKSGDLFLIGLDLVKESYILESAYDDSQGVTAEFNLNVLSRINDELGADFNLKNSVFRKNKIHFETSNSKNSQILKI